MLTYQDFLEIQPLESAVLSVINAWKSADLYKTALIADTYDKQQNETIMTFIQKMYNFSGAPVQNYVASNHKIASNFFRRLNTQRNMYSLGNGVSFAKEGVKAKFAADFDTELQHAGYSALIHGVSFLFLSDTIYCFKATEFAPLWDEETGALKGGVRFWQLDENKPLYAVLYEEDGYTKFAMRDTGKGFEIIKPKGAYIQKVQKTEAFGVETVGADNYTALPIVPLWGSERKQSTLIGMRGLIDSYDLTLSGFANDLSDCAQIFWLLENYGGMSEADLIKFRDRLAFMRIANIDTSQGGKVTPYTQEIPYQARSQYLELIKAQIYEDFGGLDVHTIAAGATNDHIDAAYQPLDENADDYEYQIIECVQQLGYLLGISKEDATPIFKRNRISNQREQVEMLVQEAEWLPAETILKKLPNITVDEIAEIEKLKEEEDMERMSQQQALLAQQEEQEQQPETGTEGELNE